MFDFKQKSIKLIFFIFIELWLLQTQTAYAGSQPNQTNSPSEIRKYFEIHAAKVCLKEDKYQEGYYDLSIYQPIINRAYDRPFINVNYLAISQEELVNEWKKHEEIVGKNWISTGVWSIPSKKGTNVTGILIHDLYLSTVGNVVELHMRVSRSDFKKINIEVADFQKNRPNVFLNQTAVNSVIDLNFR